MKYRDVRMPRRTGCPRAAELGSTNLQSAIDTVTCCGCFVFTTMTPPSERQSWRVNGVGNVCGVIATDVRKATVRLAFMFPLSSTIIQNTPSGDAGVFFVTYRRNMQLMTVGDGRCNSHIRRYLTIVFDQNRQTVAQMCSTPSVQDGVHG